MRKKNKKSAILIAASALFIHNAAIIMAMMVLMISVSRAFVQKNITYFAAGLSIAILLVVYFKIGIRLKSNRDTGANMLLFYFILAMLAFVLFGNRAYKS